MIGPLLIFRPRGILLTRMYSLSVTVCRNSRDSLSCSFFNILIEAPEFASIVLLRRVLNDTDTKNDTSIFFCRKLKRVEERRIHTCGDPKRDNQTKQWMNGVAQLWMIKGGSPRTQSAVPNKQTNQVNSKDKSMHIHNNKSQVLSRKTKH